MTKKTKKPYENTCPKCGCVDLRGKYFNKETLDADIPFIFAYKESNTFVWKEWGNAMKILKEHLHFHCHFCGYEWREEIL